MREDSVTFNQKDWDRIQKLGLTASITSPESYAKRVAQGMQLAQSTLDAMKETVPTIPTLKGLHYITFEGVHPWAGSFRQPGQEVRAGGLICSLAEDVMGDLTRLRREMITNPLSGSREYKAEVIAFYHASLLAIHPFLDGNGRVARTILETQTKRLLGHPLSQNIRRDEYVDALSRAQEQGVLGPLARIVSRRDLSVNRSIDLSKERSFTGPLRDELIISRAVFSEESEARGRRR
jgi:fido (protein-threonine AMPylation protein)